MRRGVAVVLAVLATLTACGSEGRVRTLGPEDLPRDLYGSPSPTPAPVAEREVLVYFIAEDRLVPITRQTSRQGTLPEFVLRELLSGPTADEAAFGVGTAIPDGAELLNVTLDGDLATVNLSREFELSAEQSVLLFRLGQVVYTITQLGSVARVRFQIDGESVNVVGENGTAHEVVSREEYSQLTAPPGSRATVDPEAPSPSP